MPFLRFCRKGLCLFRKYPELSPFPHLRRGKRIFDFFHLCYKLLPHFLSYTVSCKKDSQVFSVPGCPMYALFFLGSHTAVTRLLQLGHFVFVSTYFGESVPMSNRRPPHLGHLNCSIGCSSLSGIILYPPPADC